MLLGFGKILRVEEDIDPPGEFETEVLDCGGKALLPGFIDLHVHLIGGGGEGGPATRVPELRVEEIAEAGTTTVAGTLGTDDLTRSPETLLAKVKALRRHISAFMYTGSYHLPSVNLTGSVKRDLALVDEVIGVKVAIAERRASRSTPSGLKELASQAHLGGMLGDKPGLVHLHIGSKGAGLDPLFETMEATGIPPRAFLPTHMGRSEDLLQQGLRLIDMGGRIDITAPESREFDRLARRINFLQERDPDWGRISLSSDGNGSFPRFDEEGKLTGIGRGKVSRLYRAILSLAEKDVLSFPRALALITTNPAQALELEESKGAISPGFQADLVLLDEEKEIEEVYAKGERVVEKGKWNGESFDW